MKILLSIILFLFVGCSEQTKFIINDIYGSLSSESINIYYHSAGDNSLETLKYDYYHNETYNCYYNGIMFVEESSLVKLSNALNLSHYSNLFELYGQPIANINDTIIFDGWANDEPYFYIVDKINSVSINKGMHEEILLKAYCIDNSLYLYTNNNIYIVNISTGNVLSSKYDIVVNKSNYEFDYVEQLQTNYIVENDYILSIVNCFDFSSNKVATQIISLYNNNRYESVLSKSSTIIASIYDNLIYTLNCTNDNKLYLFKYDSNLIKKSENFIDIPNKISEDCFISADNISYIRNNNIFFIVPSISSNKVYLVVISLSNSSLNYIGEIYGLAGEQILTVKVD